MTRPSSGLAAAFATALLVGSAPPTATGQDPRFGEEVSVLEIEIPVQVLRGQEPVRDLTAEDFLVLDDGEPREIVGFRVVDLAEGDGAPQVAGEGAPDGASGGAGAGHAAVSDGRTILVLFDLLYSRPQYLRRALRGVREMVGAQLQPGDRIAVAYLGGTGARLIGGFASDPAEIGLAVEVFGAMLERKPEEAVERYADLAALATDRNGRGDARGAAGPRGRAEATPALQTASHELAKRFGAAGAAVMMGGGSGGAGVAVAPAGGPDPGGVSGGGTAAFSDPTIGQVAAVDAQALGASLAEAADATPIRVLTREIGRLATLLRDVPGQRQILYLSEGFSSRILNNFTSGERAFTLRVLETMFEALRKGGWTLHAIDVQGIPGPFDGRGFDADSLFYMANETGGQLLENFNRIHEATALLTKRTSLTYVLTIRPDDVVADGQLHRLDVRLREGGGWRTRVLHRTGYYAPEPDADKNPLERRMDAAELLLGRDEIDALGVRLRAGTLPAAEGLVPVPVVVEVPLAELVADRSRKRVELEAQVYAVDSTDTVQDLWVRTVHLDLASLRKGERREGVRLLAGLAVPPGEYRLRTLVSDVKGERASLTTTPLTVPADGGGLLPHDPVVVDRSAAWLRLVGLPAAGPGAATAEALAFGEGTMVPQVSPEVPGGEAMEVVVVTPGGADVELSARVLDGEGRPLPPGGAVVFGEGYPGPSKTLVRHLGIVPIAGLPPAFYVLEVSAREPGTQRAATRRLRFEIAAGG